MCLTCPPPSERILVDASRARRWGPTILLTNCGLRMFPNLLLVLMSFVVSCAWAQEKPPQAKDREQLELTTLPFPEHETVTYTWRSKGTTVGTTSFVCQRLDGEDAGKIRVTAHWSYAEAGRKHTSSSETVLYGDLAPVSYKSGIKSMSSPGLVGEARLSVQFQKGRALTTIKGAPQQEPVQKSYPVPAGAFIFGDQAFEHWALLAVALAKRSGGKLKLYQPSTGQTLEFRCEKMAGGEGNKESKLTRWSVTHPSMKAELWIDEKGALDHYRQGDLEISRTLPEAKAGEEKKKG